MWQVDTPLRPADIDALHRSGVNVIQHFGITSWTNEELQAYFDAAERGQLGVVVYLGHLLERGRGADAWQLGSAARRFVERWRQHPAIVAWHTFDEPKGSNMHASRSAQERVYRELKILDPRHPVLISQNLVSESDYDDYFSEAAFDLVDLHAYVNPDIDKRQELLLDNFKTRRSRNYPVITTLRAFNGEGWSDLRKDSLQKQYDFFVRQSGLGGNYGLYGWRLGPNRGVSQVEYIKAQLDNLRR